MLLRGLFCLLAALAASACVGALPSAIEAVPFEVRLAEPPFSDGVWCALDDDDNGQLVVRSAEQESGQTCAAMRWDPSRRVFVGTDEGDAAKASNGWAFADLGGGLLLIQFDESEGDEESDEPRLFMLLAGAVHGDAIGILPLPDDESVVAKAAAYPSIQFLTRHVPFMTPSLPADAPEDAVPPPSPHHYISEGDPEDIRSLTRDIVLEGLHRFVVDPDSRRRLPDHGVFTPVLVRAVKGAPDHPPTREQLRDIDALMKRLLALAKR